MLNKKTLLLIIILALVIFGAYVFFSYHQSHQPCNSMVSLAPGATMKDVCDQWATQLAEYKQTTRICGC